MNPVALGELMKAQTAANEAPSSTAVPLPIVNKQVWTRERRLDALRRDYGDDPVFSHLRYRTPLLMGHGSVSPKVVLLVEAPMVPDARYGPPQYLGGPEAIVVHDLLSSIDLPEHSVYRTGLVKYPLPGGRAARPEEVAASMQYLNRELGILTATLVVVFGRHLVSLVLPGLDLVHDHGVVCQGKRRWIPMFHPVAALTNADIRKALFRDFAKLNVIL